MEKNYKFQTILYTIALHPVQNTFLIWPKGPFKPLAYSHLGSAVVSDDSVDVFVEAFPPGKGVRNINPQVDVKLLLKRLIGRRFFASSLIVRRTVNGTVNIRISAVNFRINGRNTAG